MIKSYEELQKLFVKPEEAPAKIRFGNPSNLTTFEESKVVVYGVCYDETCSFGHTTERGPEGMRHASARKIETYLVDEQVEIYEKTPVFDLGDFKIGKTLSEEKRNKLFSEEISDGERKGLINEVEEGQKRFEVLKEITSFIRSQGKIPLMLGGEHTLSYWPISALA